MTKDELHKSRLMFPGIFAVIVVLLFITSPDQFLKIEINNSSLLYVGVLAIICILYYVIQPRKFIIGNRIKKINLNIYARLITDSNLGLNAKEISMTQTQNVFYTLIDNNSSLTERAKEVYMNGFILSSLADVTILSGLSSLIALCVFLINHSEKFLILFFIFLLLSLISFILIHPIYKYHLSLSNNQIDYILQNCRSELIHLLTKDSKLQPKTSHE